MLFQIITATLGGCQLLLAALAYFRPHGTAKRERVMGQTDAERLLTLGEAADRLGVQSWKIRRLFERGLLPEPERVGRNRVVREADLEAVRAALVLHGYLKPVGPPHG